ncbi:hypothetical protein HanXRQr2_Chr08g0317801 [Helianthus annuus]|uniref:Uncharacterized protein n=1 Tax=Helianthus annuus TaxID=4232 RepID=A0A9K3IBS8_HELAN|nr:hypothetical protein HanXRQr2_Chr08g0317801 [Helianthus annuus]
MNMNECLVLEHSFIYVRACSFNYFRLYSFGFLCLCLFIFYVCSYIHVIFFNG